MWRRLQKSLCPFPAYRSFPTVKPLSLPPPPPLLVWREEMEAVAFPQNLLTQSGLLLGGFPVPISPNDSSGRLSPFPLQEAMPLAGTHLPSRFRCFSCSPGTSP